MVQGSVAQPGPPFPPRWVTGVYGLWGTHHCHHPCCQVLSLWPEGARAQQHKPMNKGESKEMGNGSSTDCNTWLRSIWNPLCLQPLPITATKFVTFGIPTKNEKE